MGHLLSQSIVNDTLHVLVGRHGNVTCMLEIVERIVTVHGGNEAHVIAELVLHRLTQFNGIRVHLKFGCLLVEDWEINDSRNLVADHRSLLDRGGQAEHAFLSLDAFSQTMGKNLTEHSLEQVHIPFNQVLVRILLLLLLGFLYLLLLFLHFTDDRAFHTFVDGCDKLLDLLLDDAASLDGPFFLVRDCVFQAVITLNSKDSNILNSLCQRNHTIIEEPDFTLVPIGRRILRRLARLEGIVHFFEKTFIPALVTVEMLHSVHDISYLHDVLDDNSRPHFGFFLRSHRHGS
mmetsp:Transcript_61773/g.93277  ORF Transcript_61773/g.93277 Transcript_61773/m.93277 type:complete len:290 (+) Transcript_61773:894-1763(+)